MYGASFKESKHYVNYSFGLRGALFYPLLCNFIAVDLFFSKTQEIAVIVTFLISTHNSLLCLYRYFGRVISLLARNIEVISNPHAALPIDLVDLISRLLLVRH